MHTVSFCAQREMYGNRGKFSAGLARKSYPLRQLVHDFAGLKAHVFVGFTRCGNFLLSYTHTIMYSSLMENSSPTLASLELGTGWSYTLYVWLFVPGRKLTKLADLSLFAQFPIQDELYLCFCQWPADDRFLIVVGSKAHYRVDENERLLQLTIIGASDLFDIVDTGEHLLSIIRLPNLSCQTPPHHVMSAQYFVVDNCSHFDPRIALSAPGWIFCNSGEMVFAFRILLDEIEEQSLELTRFETGFDHCFLVERTSMLGLGIAFATSSKTSIRCRTLNIECLIEAVYKEDLSIMPIDDAKIHQNFLNLSSKLHQSLRGLESYSIHLIGLGAEDELIILVRVLVELESSSLLAKFAEFEVTVGWRFTVGGLKVLRLDEELQFIEGEAVKCWLEMGSKRIANEKSRDFPRSAKQDVSIHTNLPALMRRSLSRIVDPLNCVELVL